MTDPAPWRRPAHEGADSPYRHAGAPADDASSYRTLTYEVDGRVARLRFDRPDHTVAKIHGFCVAGGTDIALHCDQIVIAADDVGLRQAVRERDSAP